MKTTGERSYCWINTVQMTRRSLQGPVHLEYKLTAAQLKQNNQDTVIKSRPWI